MLPELNDKLFELMLFFLTQFSFKSMMSNHYLQYTEGEIVR